MAEVKEFFEILYHKINTLINYHSQPEDKKSAIEKLLNVINFAKENDCFDYKGGNCDILFRFYGTYEDIEFNKTFLNDFFKNSEVFNFIDNTCPHLSELMDLRIYTAYKLQKDKTIVYQQLKRYTSNDYINYLHDNDDEYDEENDDFEEYNYTDDFFDEDIFEITTKIPDFAQYNYYFVTGNVNLSTINSILTELYKFLKGYSVDYCYYETKEDASLYITEKNLITDSIYWTYEETCIKKEKTAFIGLLNKYNFFMEETPYSVSGFYRSFLKNEDNENRGH